LIAGHAVCCPHGGDVTMQHNAVHKSPTQYCCCFQIPSRANNASIWNDRQPKYRRLGGADAQN
jgi:hypothetical protein